MFIFFRRSPYVLVCLFAYSKISHFVAIPFFYPVRIMVDRRFQGTMYLVYMFSINNSLVSVSKHFLSKRKRLSLFKIGQRFKYTPVILKSMLIFRSLFMPQTKKILQGSFLSIYNFQTQLNNCVRNSFTVILPDIRNTLALRHSISVKSESSLQLVFLCVCVLFFLWTSF